MTEAKPGSTKMYMRNVSPPDDCQGDCRVLMLMKAED